MTMRRSTVFVLGLAAAALVTSSCEPYDPNADLTWIEPVQLASGETVTIKRHVVFRQERAWGGGFASAPVYKTSSIELVPASAEFPVWNAPLMPIVLDRDPANNEWIVVASANSCDIWVGNGRPRPPYWAFRLRSGAWYRDAIPESFYDRAANLFVGLTIADDSQSLSEHITARKLQQSYKPEHARMYSGIARSYPDIENCGSAVPTNPIGKDEIDLKNFRSLQ
jgi:hypothetical protein